MTSINTHVFKTHYGELLLGEYQNELCLCDWRYRKRRAEVDKRIQDGLHADFVDQETPVLTETKRQLQEYFDQQRTSFDIPLRLVGTAFQQKVWQSLIEIPYGSTLSYLGLSESMGNTKAIRAVAAANGANAISIIVPCHRVIGKNGELVGYAGGLPAKRKLLALEHGPFRLI